MRSLVCVDSNIALKLVFKEQDSPLAYALWQSWAEQGVQIVAPTVMQRKQVLQ